MTEQSSPFGEAGLRTRPPPRRPAILLLLTLSAATCGCPVTAPLPSDAPIHELRLPPDGPSYYLYVPSTYTREQPHPLVIACHGTPPWDSAYAEIREWADFCERRGILVAAPVLQATRGDFPPPAETQIALQRADEQTILQLVSILKGSRNIAEEQVFLAGWSAGAYAILYTGLRNPDVFRALAIRQGTFDPRFMAVGPDRLDPWQPIFVYYGNTDPLRDASLACIRWLRENDLFVEQLELPGSHRRLDVKIAWDFFRKVIRERPWIRLRAAKIDPKDRHVVRFWCDAKPAAAALQWSFGDGAASTEPTPTHRFAQPGRYVVGCRVRLAVGKRYERRLVLHIGPPSAG